MYIKKYQREDALLPDGIFHDEDWTCVWATNHWATYSHTLITRCVF